MYPLERLRRNRKVNWILELISETSLRREDLILPIFVIEGIGQKQKISTMPGVFRYSIDEMLKIIQLASKKSIKAVALFPVIETNLRDEMATLSYSENNLICRAVRAIKDASIDIGIICDVALDQYTISGHDGIISDNYIDNDKTIEILKKQALALARAGADIIAPSDMMDGRVGEIRKYLDNFGFIDVGILSYAVKYNSVLYSPFRDAVKNNRKVYLDKSTYQMDVRNIKEAMREIHNDIEECADIIMIKPAITSLDVIYKASNRFDIPIFAYQVTGEYAMLKFAAEAGAINWEKSILECMRCIKRAGASGIFTYSALEIADLL